MKLIVTELEARKICSALAQMIDTLREDVLPYATTTENRDAVHNNIARWESVYQKVNEQRKAQLFELSDGDVNYEYRQ